MTQQMSQMSQMSQSYSQTSSVQQQQSSTSQVYESTQMGGVMKGYKSKTDNELAAERDMTRNSQQFIQDNGIFGGITGDNNSLLQDGQFDSKKHSVKDLVGHFSKVKPRAEIPVQYLPEQRMFNGEQGPSLNYPPTNAEPSSATPLSDTMTPPRSPPGPTRPPPGYLRGSFLEAGRGDAEGAQRLWNGTMYTDDPYFCCVGVERTVRRAGRVALCGDVAHRGCERRGRLPLRVRHRARGGRGAARTAILKSCCPTTKTLNAIYNWQISEINVPP